MTIEKAIFKKKQYDYHVSHCSTVTKATVVRESM